MTGQDPPERDPDVQHQIDRAIRALASRLRPWAGAMQDPDAFAARYVEDLYAEGWRPWPRPRSVTAQGEPGDYAAGAAAVREAFNEALAKTREDTR
jgi:hypothetical protein